MLQNWQVIKFFQTTSLLILLCFAFTVLLAYIQYGIVLRRQSRGLAQRSFDPVIPSLVIGPVALVVAYRLFDLNLIYPLHIFADAGSLLKAATIPSLVLLFASGLFYSVRRSIAGEYQLWSSKAFVTVAKAYGMGTGKTLRRLVVGKALIDSWNRCLPWFFGELIIVEAVFNAPGLGYDAWNLARTRDFSGLLGAVGGIATLYGGCMMISAWAHRWLGKRLASYA